MKNGLIREALRIAREKLPGHPQFSHWPHYTFIVQSNAIVDWGYNTTQEPSIHLGYNAQLDGGMSKTHAELNAYRRAKGMMNQDKTFEVINIRLNRQGVLRSAQPCKCCYVFLQAMGCSQCWFSTDLGFAKIGM